MNDLKIFRKFEAIGETKGLAIDSVKDLTLMVDASQAYNKWASENAVTEDDVKVWCKEYLKKKKLDKAGLGAYIVIQSAVVDKRERPYAIETVKYETKTHTPESWYVLRDLTGNEVGREKTKKAAEQAIKEYIADFKEDVNAYREWAPKENNSLVLKGKYTPTKGARPAKIMVFGYTSAE